MKSQAIFKQIGPLRFRKDIQWGTICLQAVDSAVNGQCDLYQPSTVKILKMISESLTLKLVVSLLEICGFGHWSASFLIKGQILLHISEAVAY